MKAIIFLNAILLLMSFDINSPKSQNDFYFAKFGFDYQSMTEQKVTKKMEKVTASVSA